MSWWLPTAKALNWLGMPYPYLNRYYLRVYEHPH